MFINRPLLLLLFFTTAISVAFGNTDGFKGAQRPNIIYIMLDDLDYYDVGIYGSPDIQTVTIDKIAAEGMRFTQYYTNGPVCSPTRVSILTGHYPSRFGVKRAILDSSLRGIPGKLQTLPEMLRAEGYRTAHIGKWHVGTGKEEFLPRSSGFDYSVRLDTSAGLRGIYLDFAVSINDEKYIKYSHKNHLTEVLTSYAIDFINTASENFPNQPFFMNLWYFSPHRPLNQIPSAFDNSNTNYCIDADPSRRVCDTRRGNFAALVTNTDRQIKRILDHLNIKGLRGKTLMFVTSDNGGDIKTHDNRAIPQRTLRNVKGSVYEGAIRVPFIVSWPGVIPKNAIHDSVVASFDLFPTLMDLTGSRGVPEDLPGISFLDVLLKKSLKKRPFPLFWENKHANRAFTNNSGIFNTYAVRNGDWKLVFIPAVNKHEQDSLKLFNLRLDAAERRDLLSGQKSPLIESNAEKYSQLVNDMQYLYYQWRKHQGDIKYSLKLSSSGVQLADNILEFKGGNATIARDVRFDFHDGDFSFAVWINPAKVSGRSVVVEKPGSWHILIEEGILQLILIEQKRGHKNDKHRMVLKAAVKENVEQHVAFTIFGWRDDPSTVRLYLNGELVDESTATNAVKEINSQDTPEMPMIFLGSNSENDAPYHGTMRIPRFSVLCFYPSEVFWDYTRPLLAKHRLASHGKSAYKNSYPKDPLDE